jgi:hypothetical protein
MAVNTLTKIFQITLTNADALVYLCPALTTAVITALYKVNVTAADKTFRLHQVDGGGASAISNALYYDEPITTKRVHPRVDGSIILTAGESLRGLASANSAVVLTGFGILVETTA